MGSAEKPLTIWRKAMKPATEMEFNEFVDWATGHILLGIGNGRSLRELVHSVVDLALRNTVFGGARKAK
jgi:hypothetical protein